MINIDLTIFSIQKIGGISVVWSEYLKRLKVRGNGLEYKLYYPENDNRIASELDLSQYEMQTTKPRGVITKYFPFLLMGKKNDVLHTSYYQWYPLYRGIKILTLHDFMHEKFGSSGTSILHNILKYLSLNSTDVVLCISEATKNDFKEIYPKIYSKKDVRIIENSVSDIFYPEVDSSTHDEYFLWVAGRSGYKNFKYALDILSYLKQQGSAYCLSVVGLPLSDDEKEYAMLKGVLDQITVFSNVSMDELRSLYSNALALLYLSKYEGFGLPILEAQKCCCPVVALKNPASIEVGMNSILYINDGSTSEILDIIESVKDNDKRNVIINSGVENAGRYNWNSSVDKLIKVYKDYHS